MSPGQIPSAELALGDSGQATRSSGHESVSHPFANCGIQSGSPNSANVYFASAIVSQIAERACSEVSCVALFDRAIPRHSLILISNCWSKLAAYAEEPSSNGIAIARPVVGRVGFFLVTWESID